MKHAFDVYTYDKKNPDNILKHNKVGNTVVNISVQNEDHKVYFEMLRHVDGPIFVCLPTPMKADGSADTSIVESVVKGFEKVAEATRVNRGHQKRPVIVIKSTVPPGTTAKLGEQCKHLHVCFNPEFLTERSATEDFKNQDRIIVGGPRPGTDVLKKMYEISFSRVPVTKTSSTIAEMVKYTTNVFLATKVSVANDLKQICNGLDDVDYDKVVEYATKDTRLGSSHWSVPGPDGKAGFGGSCFPKDLNALIHVAKSLGVSVPTLEGAWKTNLKVRPEKDWEKLKGRAVV
jgi:UDPglucose 6-dehydrogenase